MRFLRNTWYVAAGHHEVIGELPLGRVVLGEPIVLWRDTTGGVQALQDRCPHRFLPLSRGRIRDGMLVCGYHGLGFASSGRCVHNPHGTQVPPRQATLRRYPAVERYGAVWLWMGDESCCDEALIPAFPRFDPRQHDTAGDYLRVQANYQLAIDNLLDLSHLDHVHAHSLSAGHDTQAEIEVRHEGRTVHSLRLNRDEQMPAGLAQRHGYPPGQRVDRWLDMRWEAPGNMELVVGHAPIGLDNPRAHGMPMVFGHFVTPETATTTHYWFAVTRPRADDVDAAPLLQEQLRFLKGPFQAEDAPVLEAQQRALGDTPFWDARPILLNTDAAAVRARRLLDALIEAECTSPPARPSHLETP